MRLINRLLYLEVACSIHSTSSPSQQHRKTLAFFICTEGPTMEPWVHYTTSMQGVRFYSSSLHAVRKFFMTVKKNGPVLSSLETCLHRRIASAATESMAGRSYDRPTVLNRLDPQPILPSISRQYASSQRIGHRPIRYFGLRCYDIGLGRTVL